MAKTAPFKKFKPKDWPVKFYGCEKYKLYSNKYLECLTRSYTATIVSSNVIKQRNFVNNV